MKPGALLLLCFLLSAATFGQSIQSPLVASSDDHTTIITQIETNSHNTVVSFRHICFEKGDWVQLNKSMYLQDANGEARYNYVRSEGIPLRPAKFTATEDNQEVNFKVYFEKVKPGTKEINVIERARSLDELRDGISFFNYYKVSLYKSMPALIGGRQGFVTDVLSMPRPEMGMNTVQVDTARIQVDKAYSNFASPMNRGGMAYFGPMMNGVYASVLNAQLQAYSNPAITDQLAKITKNYYDALIKAGFSEDAALKIITSKQLISIDEVPK
jgi:hypothetical protein